MGKKYQEIPKGLTIYYNCVTINTHVQSYSGPQVSRLGTDRSSPCWDAQVD